MQNRLRIIDDTPGGGQDEYKLWLRMQNRLIIFRKQNIEQKLCTRTQNIRLRARTLNIDA